MRSATLALFVSLILGLPETHAGTTDIERRVYDTRRVDPAPRLDGILDDAAWGEVDWSGGFIQRDPADGEPPSQETKFKVVYDDHAIYFGVRAHDEPAETASHLARRDGFPGDWVEVNIDSYNDRRTAFSFTLSLSGTRGDEFVSNDGRNVDGNWDPVWEGATHEDDEGWTAEIKIPLSQLRFSGADEQSWGLQVQRRLFRKEERSTWQPIPKDVSGWVSRFGELRGIRKLEPGRRIELLPYGVAKAERLEGEAGNPFQDGSDSGLAAGLDGKIGVTSELTLDFTVNPDFGQVEADPSQVNLTAFETFFEEKRPFFVEGSNIFDLPLAPAITGGPFTRDRLFYSRRIGHRPSHSPDLEDDEYAEEPDNTSILGAFKLSGKTPGGMAIGVLETLTAQEQSHIALAGQRREEVVEPRTNYFVGRVQQDFRGGDTQLGAMLTSVHRRIDAEHLEFLPSQAYAAGADFSHYFRNRDYQIEANLFTSHLRGSQEAMDELQTSSARYYQRPDNDHVDYDPTRTTLDGHAGSIRLFRSNNSQLMFQTGAAWRSPGFEINDLGFMRSADEINHFTWVGYNIRNPFSIFRSYAINYNHWLNWDFGGNFLSAAMNMNTHARFRNNYRMGGGVTREWDYTSNTKLRGGPASRWPGNWAYQIYGFSDSRPKLQVGGGAYTRKAEDEDFREIFVELTYRPTNALRLSLQPTYHRNQAEMQYVDTLSFDEDDRYLFASLDQKTVSLTLRLDLCLTPNLTIQYYGSPFVSSGRYSQLKRITDPMAPAYRDRFERFAESQLGYLADDALYQIDEDRDGATDYELDDPDFDLREFNSTLVARWEYRPGSMLYVVWSQARVDEALRVGDFAFRDGMNDLLETRPHDVFLIKFSKWFSM